MAARVQWCMSCLTLPSLPPLQQACTECGCTAGTAAVQTAGAELEAEALQRLRSAIARLLAADRATAGGAAAGNSTVAGAAGLRTQQEAVSSAQV